MTATSHPRGFCLLIWGSTLLIPLLLAAAVILPWWQKVRVLEEQLAQGVDQLQRYQRVLASLPGMREALRQEQAKDDFKAFYFDAETPALAGAKLQSEVQEVIRAAGARPISTQILPADTDEQPPRVRIRTQLQGSTEELLDVLYRIEAARPFLFVDQVSIRSTAPRARPSLRGGRRVGGRQRLQPQVGELTVRLDIFGYSLGRAP